MHKIFFYPYCLKDYRLFVQLKMAWNFIFMFLSGTWRGFGRDGIGLQIKPSWGVTLTKKLVRFYRYVVVLSVAYPECFWADRYIHWTHVWHRAVNYLKFLPLDDLEIHSLSLLVPIFLCKTFPKLIKFTWRDILLCGWFLKIHIFKTNFCGYELVNAAKQSVLRKYSASSTEGILLSSTNVYVI